MPVTDDTEPPGSREAEEQYGEKERKRLERALPELIKRVFEAGLGKISEGPENVRQLVSELKLPKEVLNLIFAQLDETKNGMYRTVSREIRDFLEHTNFSDELAKALTRLSLEVRTEVRFIPNESGSQGVKPDVPSKDNIRREPGSKSPTEPGEPPEDDEASAGSEKARESSPPLDAVARRISEWPRRKKQDSNGNEEDSQ
jgi:hypothetical protein